MQFSVRLSWFLLFMVAGALAFSQQPPAATLIVDNAAREVRNHFRTYEQATNEVLEDAKTKLKREVAHLAGRGRVGEAIAVGRMIETLPATVAERANAPNLSAIANPPPLEKWVIGQWTGANTPHIFNFSEQGGFEGIGKTPKSTNVFGTWKSILQGYIDVDVKNGNSWTIRRCGPNAMAVVVTDHENKQMGDGIVLLRVLDPVAGIWKWHDGSIREMWGDGQVKDRPGGRWRATNPSAREYSFSWGNGAVIDVLTLSADGRTLRGKNQSGVDLTAKRVD